MDATSSAGADYMPVRLLRLVAAAEHTPNAGQSGLDVLTRVCTDLINADVPASIVPLLSAARLIPLDKGGNKIRPIAIGGVLRRLVTKIGIADDVPRNVPYLLPQQVSSGVRSGGAAMFHTARDIMRRRGRDTNLVMVSIDASNAFNRFSRQQMLNLLPTRCPSLARFINMMYGHEPPALMYGHYRLSSREGAQQGDPASMLLFSLVIQPILRALSLECPDLLLNIFYADDGTLIGTPETVARALAIIEREGPAVGYFIEPAKSKIFWPSMSLPRLQPLLTAYPTLQIQGTPTGEISTGPTDGIVIFGAPLGSPAYIRHFLDTKMAALGRVLDDISAIPDPRLAFHLQRSTAGICRFTHLARLLPADVLGPTAVEFDTRQRALFTLTTGIALSAAAQRQATLPLRHGGLGLTPLRLIAPIAYAASTIDTAPLRARWLSSPADPVTAAELVHAAEPLVAALRPHLAPIADLPTTTAAALADHPTHNQKLLSGAFFDRRASLVWRDADWTRRTHRSAPASPDLLALRARRNATTNAPSVAFLTACYHETGYISPPVWAIILRRYLGLHVYDAPAPTLVCPACAAAHKPSTIPLDRDGHHAVACRNGYGWHARHTAVVLRVARHVLTPAGLSHRREVPMLLPDNAKRPADLYVTLPPPADGMTPPKPHALDITVVSPHPSASGCIEMLKAAAEQTGGRAVIAHFKKIRTLRSAAGTALTNLPFNFYPLAFDAYGTPSPQTSLYFRDVGTAIARNSGAPLHLCLRRIYQQTSFAIWATVAQSVLIRDPGRLLAAGYTRDV